MNLFFYSQTFILNYSFIVILSDHIFLLCFITTQPFVKRKPVKTGKKYRNDRVPFYSGFTVFIIMYPFVTTSYLKTIKYEQNT
jgi:hypothetical protein